MADLGGLVPGAQPCTGPHDHNELVCVLCGVPWCPPIANRCPNPDCRGFCTWGPAKGAKPSSWVDYENLIPEPVPPLTDQQHLDRTNQLGRELDR